MNEVKPQHREPNSRSGPSSGSFKLARVEVQELAALAGPEVAGPGADLLSDELLIERVLSGEFEHYEVLMRRASPRLYRIARAIDGNSRDAEDVLRETFIRAYESLPSYDRRLRFADWLCRIAIHQALARLKRGVQQPSERVRSQQQDLVRQLEHAVDDLPNVFRIAFTLCTLDQMNVSEVAQSLSLPVSLVSLQAFRGRLQVRRLLGMRSDDAEARSFGLPLSNADAIIRSVMDRIGDRV